MEQKLTAKIIIVGLLLSALGYTFNKLLAPQVDLHESANPSKSTITIQQRLLDQRSLFQPLTPAKSRSIRVNTELAPKQSGLLKANNDADKKQTETVLVEQKVQSGLPKAKLRQGSQKEQVATRFNKIDFYGRMLPGSALTWSCARDVKTGMLWETKLFDAGVSDIEHRFSWYDPAKSSPGVKNNGHCFAIDCDTDAYVKEINRLGLCGSTAWRLPSFAELQTLLDRDYAHPAINQEIFFNTKGASYWTSSQLAYDPDMVMQIRFFDGTSSPAPVHMNLAVRLVSQ